MDTEVMCHILLRAADIAVQAGNTAKALELVERVEQIITLFVKGK